ncbi:hypothetical protein IFR05_011267 [Cadophora sp. M221]|nr:hypothetical protein IFR05_011267 [Cadophora sp. M221]
MTTSPPISHIPSETDDEADDADLPPRQKWAYPCKQQSCPDYGKSWLLRSNFLLQLKEQDAHSGSATTPAERRTIELEWRYSTDTRLPPRAAPEFRLREDPDTDVWDYSFKDDRGRVISGRGTQQQMEVHRARVMHG